MEQLELFNVQNIINTSLPIIKWKDYKIPPNDGWYNLTEMWKATGSEYNKRPNEWLRLPNTQDFLSVLQDSHKAEKSRFVKTVRGTKTPGTYGNVDVAVAYGMYLSAEFKAYVINIFKEFINEEVFPDKGILRAVRNYKKQGQTDQWIEIRTKSIIHRNAFTEELYKRKVRGRQFAIITDSMYKNEFGMTSKEIRKKFNLKPSDNIRNYMNSISLTLVDLGENVSIELMKKEKAQGFKECKSCTDCASRIVGETKKKIEEAFKKPILEKNKRGVKDAFLS